MTIRILFLLTLFLSPFSVQAEEKELPRVLLIGDSISIGYTKHVQEMLKGKVDVQRVKGNAGNTGRGLVNLPKYLDPKLGKWDVIHFNWGLWDLCYRHPESKNKGKRDKENGTVTHPPEEYRENLKKLVATLKKTNATLIWASTTPVPENEVGRKVGDDDVYNKIAAEVMQANDIQINDLHSLMKPHMKTETTAPGNVHFTEAGSKRLAAQVVKAIEAALKNEKEAEEAGDSCGDIKTAYEWEGKPINWHGFNRFDFIHAGRKCIVIMPTKIAQTRPWIWRARFFGHEPQTDITLLNQGFHVVYCDVSNLYGSPSAVKHWNNFYKFLTTDHNFSKKVALEGMSRGGLIIYNWAAANPEKVACIYGDAPVCDFKSWPGGKGKGKGSPGSWNTCLKAYGFTEAEALAYKGNPIDNLKPLADAKIPLLNVVGDADDVVPVAENTAILETRYKALGGPIQVIHKPGIGHHPHSLKDPAPIVDFVLKHTGEL